MLAASAEPQTREEPGFTAPAQDKRGTQQPSHSLEPHRERDLSRRRWPGPRFARDGHPPRSHSRCRQRHRAPLRTLHCCPLVPWSVTRRGRRQRSSRRDARVDSQSAATNRAGVRRRVGGRPRWARQRSGRAARSRGGPRQSRPTSRRWHRSESVAPARGPDHGAGLCADGQARRLRLHSPLRRPAAWARGALSGLGSAHAVRHRPRTPSSQRPRSIAQQALCVRRQLPQGLRQT